MESRRFSVLVCLILYALATSCASAIIVTSDMTIDDGDAFAELIIKGASTRVDMIGGRADKVTVYDSAVINISDGQVRSYLCLLNSATANLTGGTIKELFAVDSSIINLYAMGYHHDATGGQWGTGRITGLWLDGEPFGIDLYDSSYYGNDTFAHVTFLPEPCSLMLVGLGGLAILRRR